MHIIGHKISTFFLGYASHLHTGKLFRLQSLPNLTPRWFGTAPILASLGSSTLLRPSRKKLTLPTFSYKPSYATGENYRKNCGRLARRQLSVGTYCRIWTELKCGISTAKLSNNFYYTSCLQMTWPRGDLDAKSQLKILRLRSAAYTTDGTGVSSSLV